MINRENIRMQTLDQQLIQENRLTNKEAGLQIICENRKTTELCGNQNFINLKEVIAQSRFRTKRKN